MLGALGLLLVIAIALIVMQLIGGEETEIPKGSVDQPFTYETGKQLEIPETVEYTNFDPGDDTTAPIYEFALENKVDLVKSFLGSIGKRSMELEEYEDVVYYWRDDPSDDFYVVEYNALTDRVFFRFESAVDPDLNAGGYLSREDLEQYFTAFVHEYWDQSYSYTDFNVTRDGSTYRIEASRLIGKYPLHISGFEEYSDYLVVEDDGDILEGQIYLMNYDLSTAQNVDLITTVGLGSVIGRDDYPKDFYQLEPQDLDGTLLYGEPYTPAQSAGDPPPTPDGEIPELTECTAEEISLVYLYMSGTYQMLTPAYKIRCAGNVVVEGRSYRTEALVFANAIDPELVYVPATTE